MYVLEPASCETSRLTVRRKAHRAITEKRKTQEKGETPTALSPDGRGRERDGRPKK